MEDNWISVKDRFPEPETSVLVCENGQVGCAYYWDYCGKMSFHSGGDEYFPTHWMPLPEPPNEQ